MIKAKFTLLCFLLCTAAVSAQSPKSQNNLASQAISVAKVDLNKADLTTLIHSFKGIGKKRAEAIIAYRESHQGFKSIEEFAEVKGFGQRFIEANREKLKDVFVIR